MSGETEVARYQVYHACDLMAMLFPDPQHWLLGREHMYRHVADVYAPLDRVFALTNHNEGVVWTRREEVCLVVSALLRSTSVGDVFVASLTGRAWLVVGSGLQEIDG